VSRRADAVIALPALRVGRSRLRTAAAAAVASSASVLLFARRTGFDAVASSFFVCVLVALAVIDLDRHIIPNRILLPAIVVLMAANASYDLDRGASRMAWGAGAFAVLLVLALVYPAGLGMGDVKLAFFLGLGLGRSVVAALLIASVCAGAAGTFVLARYGRAARKAALPFGPFIALGAVLALFALAPR
jgi:leader peptidase (prepilin peptidase)/N-methyltransferase